MGEVINMTINRTNLVFTLLQAVAAGIALLGTAAAIYLGCVGISAFLFFLDGAEPWHMAYAVIGVLTVLAVSVFSYAALYSFFTMCQRLKKGTAFTHANEKGMHRIALSCGVCGGSLVLAGVIALFYGGFALAFLEIVAILAAAYLCIGLVAYALELLLQRATAIQQENDLTI